MRKLFEGMLEIIRMAIGEKYLLSIQINYVFFGPDLLIRIEQLVSF